MVLYRIISNNTINSFFLSRYIAKKLAQKFSLRYILRPIRKEIFRVIRRGIVTFRKYYRNKQIIRNYSIYKNLFIKNFVRFFLLYQIASLIKYCNHFIW
jgi:hypothetical protein